MILDRSKLPQNDFSSIFRRILDVFSSIWARFGFDFLRDLVRRPARLSIRFSAFAGPPRYAGRSRFNDLLPVISICAAVSGNACGSLLDRRQVAKCSCPVRLRHPFVAGQHRAPRCWRGRVANPAGSPCGHRLAPDHDNDLSLSPSIYRSLNTLHVR